MAKNLVIVESPARQNDRRLPRKRLVVKSLWNKGPPKGNNAIDIDDLPKYEISSDKNRSSKT